MRKPNVQHARERLQRTTETCNVKHANFSTTSSVLASLWIINHLQPQLRRSCWACTMCLLDALPRDLSFISTIDFSQEQNDSTHSTSSEEDPLRIMSNMRKRHHNQDLLVHLNINSIANKFDELKKINKKLKASLLILTQRKIDCSYPNNQSKLTGYRMHRNDRAEEE